jgi:hypothetical protein
LQPRNRGDVSDAPSSGVAAKELIEACRAADLLAWQCRGLSPAPACMDTVVIDNAE